MYIPKNFSQTDFETVKDFIAGSPLANIMASNGDSVEICPAPLLWQVDEQNPLGYQLKQTNPSHKPWFLSDAPSDYINAMCRAIVGIKLTIHNFEAKFKLSQNKTLDNQQGVIDGLTQLQSASADNMATLINNLFKE